MEVALDELRPDSLVFARVQHTLLAEVLQRRVTRQYRVIRYLMRQTTCITYLKQSKRQGYFI